MTLDRRGMLVTTGLGLGLMSTIASAKPKPEIVGGRTTPADLGLEADSALDQTDALQQLIDEAAARRQVLHLPAGQFRARGLTLRKLSRIVGVGGATTLLPVGGGTLLEAEGEDDISLEGVALDGRMATSAPLIRIRRAERVTLSGLALRNVLGHAIVLEGCSGSVRGSTISHVGDAAIFSTDATGLEIGGNVIQDVGNNGILVWRTAVGEDGTVVSGNRIERVAAQNGGSGPNGNGINVFRAGNVVASGNHIADCAFTAIRGNAASNIQMIGNHCRRLGEVALYAEFGFQGALIASNIVDGAATGVAVTNFNEGGRLAVVQGNLIRNLFRREYETVDKRGDGIAVEADATVTGNTVENAPACGILVGWGRHMRNVVVNANLVRSARIGIGVTGDSAAGAVMITSNIIAGARDGAIRALKHAEPYGPDLAGTRTESPRVLIERNLAS